MSDKPDGWQTGTTDIGDFHGPTDVAPDGMAAIGDWEPIGAIEINTGDRYTRMEWQVLWRRPLRYR